MTRITCIKLRAHILVVILAIFLSRHQLSFTVRPTDRISQCKIATGRCDGSSLTGEVKWNLRSRPVPGTFGAGSNFLGPHVLRGMHHSTAVLLVVLPRYRGTVCHCMIALVEYFKEDVTLWEYRPGKTIFQFTVVILQKRRLTMDLHSVSLVDYNRVDCRRMTDIKILLQSNIHKRNSKYSVC